MVELADGQSIEADELLVAVGRASNVAGLGLEAAGVTHSAKGIHTDRYLRTTQRRLYAAGDVTGGPQFTHYAGWQGFIAVRNAFLPLNTAAVRQVRPSGRLHRPGNGAGRVDGSGVLGIGWGTSSSPRCGRWPRLTVRSRTEKPGDS